MLQIENEPTYFYSKGLKTDLGTEHKGHNTCKGTVRERLFLYPETLASGEFSVLFSAFTPPECARPRTDLLRGAVRTTYISGTRPEMQSQ